MEIVKRILAVVVMVISAIFIIVCLAAIFFSWSYNTPVTEAITKTITGVERILTAADTGLDRLNTRLAEAETAVDNMEEAVETAGEEIAETSLIYEVLDRTVGDELFPKIESARETSAAVGASLVAFNDTLEAVNEIPLVEVPTLTEELENASERLTEIRNDVQETKDELRAVREEAVSKPVTAITTRTTRISDGLKKVQAAFTNTQDNIGDNLVTIGDIKARVPGLIDLISIISTFLFFWIGFGQVSLIVHAWGYVKGKGEADNGEEDQVGKGPENEGESEADVTGQVQAVTDPETEDESESGGKGDASP